LAENKLGFIRQDSAPPTTNTLGVMNSPNTVPTMDVSNIAQPMETASVLPDHVTYTEILIPVWITMGLLGLVLFLSAFRWCHDGEYERHIAEIDGHAAEVRASRIALRDLYGQPEDEVDAQFPLPTVPTEKQRYWLWLGGRSKSSWACILLRIVWLALLVRKADDLVSMPWANIFVFLLVAQALALLRVPIVRIGLRCSGPPLSTFVGERFDYKIVILDHLYDILIFIQTALVIHQIHVLETNPVDSGNGNSSGSGDVTNWAIIFIPFWIIVALYLYFVQMVKMMVAVQTRRCLMFFIYLAWASCIFIFLVMFCMYLNQSHSITLLAVYIPLWTSIPMGSVVLFRVFLE
jgi:hypothetical protein